MHAIDTNVLLYAVDDSEPLKQATARELIDRLMLTPGKSVLLWQVACEYLSCLRRWQRAGKLTALDVDKNLDFILAAFPLALPIANVLIRSKLLTLRYSLSHWDSLLLSAAMEAGVDMLYSEDLQGGASYETLTIVNPFA